MCYMLLVSIAELHYCCVMAFGMGCVFAMGIFVCRYGNMSIERK